MKNWDCIRPVFLASLIGEVQSRPGLLGERLELHQMGYDTVRPTLL